MGKINIRWEKNVLREKTGYCIYLAVLGILLFFCWRNANVLHLYWGESHAGRNNSMDQETIWEGHSWSGEVTAGEKGLKGVSLLFEKDNLDMEKGMAAGTSVVVVLSQGEEVLQQWDFSAADIREKSAYKCILDGQVPYDGKETYTVTVFSDAQTLENGVKISDVRPVSNKIRAQVIKPILGGIILLLFFFVIFIGTSKWEMHRKYCLMAGVFGLCYMFCLPYGRVPDEVSHFLRIFEITEGHMISEMAVDEDGKEIRGRELPTGIDGNISQHTTVFQDMVDQRGLEVGADVKWYEFSNMALYSPVSYLPQLVGTGIGRLLSRHVYFIIYMGRIASFLISLVLVTWAIKLLPIKRECMLLIALLPVFFQEMISLSADSFINALSLFVIAYIFYLMYDDGMVTGKRKCLLYALAVLLALCKVVYVPLIFLCFLIPNEKFGNRKKGWLCKIAAAAIAVGVNLIWTIMGDIGAAVSASGEGMSQTEWILKYPWGFINVAYRTVMEFGDKVLMEYLGNSLGGLNIKIDEFPLLLLGAVIFLYAVIPVDEEKKQLGGGLKLAVTAIWMTILAMIWGSMYLGYNNVGNYLIVGFQGRYLIPIAFLMALSLESRHFTVDEKNWDKYLYPLVGSVNLYSLILIFTQMSNCF